MSLRVVHIDEQLSEGIAVFLILFYVAAQASHNCFIVVFGLDTCLRLRCGGGQTLVSWIQVQCCKKAADKLVAVVNREVS